MPAVALNAQKRPFANKTGTAPRGGSGIVVDISANKDDALYLPIACRMFRVDGAGAVKFTVYGEDGNAKDITRNFTAGQVWDSGLVIRVWSTGTTATGIDGTP